MGRHEALDNKALQVESAMVAAQLGIAADWLRPLLNSSIVRQTNETFIRRGVPH
jgi:hypothetical protein